MISVRSFKRPVLVLLDDTPIASMDLGMEASAYIFHAMRPLAVARPDLMPRVSVISRSEWLERRNAA